MERRDRDEGEVITFSFPSRLELLPVLDRLVQGITEQMEFDEDAAGEVAISVIEAGTNAIQHGHKHNQEKQVDFRFDMRPDYLLVTVVDSGPGFEPDMIPRNDPSNPEDLMRSSGRGIYIMRRMMDQVDFDIDPARGTRVLLKKLRRTNGRSPSA
ncbi:MAG: ATP-binding protein [Candidatus Eisenbacteria bacterium]|nr:ATP-binding protein [Candidatus Eisenbacteria bacterium]